MRCDFRSLWVDVENRRRWSKAHLYPLIPFPGGKSSTNGMMMIQSRFFYPIFVGAILDGYKRLQNSLLVWDYLRSPAKYFMFCRVFG